MMDGTGIEPVMQNGSTNELTTQKIKNIDKSHKGHNKYLYTYDNKYTIAFVHHNLNRN